MTSNEATGAAPPAARQAAARGSLRPSPAEGVFFAVAAALVALHAVVDAFVFLEPGVSRADRLVPGLVPVAVLALCAWLFPCVRSVLGAAAAVVLGALALVGFAVTVSGARADGVGGSDWTGFLLAPAGVVLVGLGAVRRLLGRHAGEPGDRRHASPVRRPAGSGPRRPCAGGLDAPPTEYERRVAGFFEETLPPVRFSRAAAGP